VKKQIDMIYESKSSVKFNIAQCGAAAPTTKDLLTGILANKKYTPTICVSCCHDAEIFNEILTNGDLL